MKKVEKRTQNPTKDPKNQAEEPEKEEQGEVIGGLLRRRSNAGFGISSNRSFHSEGMHNNSVNLVSKTNKFYNSSPDNLRAFQGQIRREASEDSSRLTMEDVESLREESRGISHRSEAQLTFRAQEQTEHLEALQTLSGSKNHESEAENFNFMNNSQPEEQEFFSRRTRESGSKINSTLIQKLEQEYVDEHGTQLYSSSSQGDDFYPINLKINPNQDKIGMILHSKEKEPLTKNNTLRNEKVSKMVKNIKIEHNFNEMNEMSENQARPSNEISEYEEDLEIYRTPDNQPPEALDDSPGPLEGEEEEQKLTEEEKQFLDVYINGELTNFDNVDLEDDEKAVYSGGEQETIEYLSEWENPSLNTQESIQSDFYGYQANMIRVPSLELVEEVDQTKELGGSSIWGRSSKGCSYKPEMKKQSTQRVSEELENLILIQSRYDESLSSEEGSGMVNFTPDCKTPEISPGKASPPVVPRLNLRSVRGHGSLDSELKKLQQNNNLWREAPNGVDQESLSVSESLTSEQGTGINKPIQSINQEKEGHKEGVGPVEGKEGAKFEEFLEKIEVGKKSQKSKRSMKEVDPGLNQTLLSIKQTIERLKNGSLANDYIETSKSGESEKQPSSRRERHSIRAPAFKGNLYPGQIQTLAQKQPKKVENQPKPKNSENHILRIFLLGLENLRLIKLYKNCAQENKKLSMDIEELVNHMKLRSRDQSRLGEEGAGVDSGVVGGDREGKERSPLRYLHDNQNMVGSGVGVDRRFKKVKTANFTRSVDKDSRSSTSSLPPVSEKVAKNGSQSEKLKEVGGAVEGRKRPEIGSKEVREAKETQNQVKMFVLGLEVERLRVLLEKVQETSMLQTSHNNELKEEIKGLHHLLKSFKEARRLMITQRKQMIQKDAKIENLTQRLNQIHAIVKNLDLKNFEELADLLQNFKKSQKSQKPKNPAGPEKDQKRKTKSMTGFSRASEFQTNPSTQEQPPSHEASVVRKCSIKSTNFKGSETSDIRPGGSGGSNGHNKTLILPSEGSSEAQFRSSAGSGMTPISQHILLKELEGYKLRIRILEDRLLELFKEDKRKSLKIDYLSSQIAAASERLGGEGAANFFANGPATETQTLNSPLLYSQKTSSNSHNRNNLVLNSRSERKVSLEDTRGVKKGSSRAATMGAFQAKESSSMVVATPEVLFTPVSVLRYHTEASFPVAGHNKLEVSAGSQKAQSMKESLTNELASILEEKTLKIQQVEKQKQELIDSNLKLVELIKSVSSTGEKLDLRLTRDEKQFIDSHGYQ